MLGYVMVTLQQTTKTVAEIFELSSNKKRDISSVLFHSELTEDDPDKTLQC